MPNYFKILRHRQSRYYLHERAKFVLWCRPQLRTVAKIWISRGSLAGNK